MHKKILTGENLMKINFAGPYRCVLCNQAPETIDHLFVDYPFAHNFWTLTLHGLNTTVPSKISIVDLFSTWKDHYSSNITNKSLWARVWITIPKFVCWKLWLARNENIFNNITWTPSIVAAKSKCLLIETLSNQFLKPETTLLPEEKKWFGTFVFRHRNQSAVRPIHNPEWRLRDKDEIFRS